MTSPHRAYDDGDGSASDYAAFEDGPGPHVETSEARTYKTRRVPLGIPHIVRFATETGPRFPEGVTRFVFIMLARYANPQGLSNVPVTVLMDVCNLGSPNTVRKCLNFLSACRLVAKMPNKGGQDRVSNSYQILGEEHGWQPIEQDSPDTHPVVALVEARRRIAELEAELAAIKGAIGHTPIGHSVTNGEPASPDPDTALHSYETDATEQTEGTNDPIGHVTVTNGKNAREYQSRRERVEQLLIQHWPHFERQFAKGFSSAVYTFSLSVETEDDLMSQIATIEAAIAAGIDPGPRTKGGGSSVPEAPTGDGDVSHCPHCGDLYPVPAGRGMCIKCYRDPEIRRLTDG